MIKKNLEIIRGYKKLKEQNNLRSINKIKSELIECNHNIKNNSILFNYNFNNINDITNQYLSLNLTSRFFSNKGRLNGLVEAILLYHGTGKPVIFPLPQKWIGILIRNNILVNQNASKFLFFKYILIRYLRGIFYLLKTFFSYFEKNKYLKLESRFNECIMFDNLNNCQFPNNNEEESHDIFTFYKEKISNQPILFLHNNLSYKDKIKDDIKFHKFDIPPLLNFKHFLNFIFWGVYIFFLLLYKLLIFEWWFLLMFEELIKSKRVDLAKNNLCDRYLFYNDWLYRPMWTYIAQKYGSEICFYFYSTNSEGFKTVNGYKDNDFDWRTISWQKYFVWDEYQENFIKKYAKLNPIFQIVGPTYFQSKIEINNNNYFSKDSITIFDITPFRPSYYMKLGLEHDYFNYQVAKEFLSDILVIAEHYNLKIYLKIKRKINLKYHDRSYYNFLDTLSCNKRVVFVDSDISPFHIIKKSSLCISYPFTSTALIAKYLNKPSCYYDPTSTIYKDDTGAHGVDIITNKEELLQWIGNYIYHK